MTTLTMPGRVAAPVGKTSIARSVDRTLRPLWARLAHAVSDRRSARALAQLDDRMLRDIGLRRSGPVYVAHADCERGL